MGQWCPVSAVVSCMELCSVSVESFVLVYPVLVLEKIITGIKNNKEKMDKK